MFRARKNGHNSSLATASLSTQYEELDVNADILLCPIEVVATEVQ